MANFISNGNLAPEVLEDVFKSIIAPVFNFKGRLTSGGPMTVAVVGDDNVVYLTFTFSTINQVISSGLVTKLASKLKFQILSGSGRFSIDLHASNSALSAGVTLNAAQAINSGGGGGGTCCDDYDPPTDNPNNVPVLFTRANSTITLTTPVTQQFTAGVYHYNVNLNSIGEVVSISAWGPGATGLVNGY
jgi:hypothetical protein